MLHALIVAGLSAAPTPTIVVASSQDAAAPAACPVVAPAGRVAAACGDETKSLIPVVEGASVARVTLGAAPSPPPAPAPVVIETSAAYAEDGGRIVRLSMQTTPEQAARDMLTLRAVAASLETSAPSWRAREF